MCSDISVDEFKPRPDVALNALYEPLRHTLERSSACLEWELQLPWIDAIQRLKQHRRALILAHTYQAPEIFHGVADITGDSLALAQAAASAEAELIVLCGVYFMAETAKILAPGKRVLIADALAGCSLADAISAEDVRQLRRQHPGVPVVSYVNTSAAVKAESDACCTSANAVQVVESMGTQRVIFVPDRYLGSHVAAHTEVELILWPGSCEVHERFTARQVREARRQPDTRVLAHPECRPEVLQEADFVGSTHAMAQWLARERPAEVALITECAMSDNLRAQFPEVRFASTCQLCPHMKRITLPGIHHCLLSLEHEVKLDEAVSAAARRALQAMLKVGRPTRP
ncbi:quinolinate synthase NadA [Pseudomarimonas arenosa]|uniref:Quinolinate synthase n=1 Tax=Pseudomarimonas arenosa TaxID=2774145 RepID=A0AAW3ZNJ7_9GAMM|nr:quinolinate synthase NadA [Pseudomarimonas arenosa]MBD8526207.1 quinolinate synthase NadA [Pseudomarimonas arenosa]